MFWLFGSSIVIIQNRTRALWLKCFVHFSALLAVILMLSAFSALLLVFWIATIEYWLDTESI